MSYPLIREPSPLQQLAATLTAIRGRFDERRALNEEMRRRAEYLNLAKQEMAQREAYNTQNFALQQTRIDEARKDRGLSVEAAAVQAQREATQQGFENHLRKIQSIRQGVPDNVTISHAQAGLEADNPELAYKIPGLLARAQETAARLPFRGEGRTGDIARAAVPVSAGGVTFTPPTVNLSAPVRPGGGGLGHIAQRVELGAGLMDRIVARANELYAQNPRNVEEPLSGDFGAAMADYVLGAKPGSALHARARNLGSSQEQIEFRGLREQVKHALSVFFPRVSIALMENLADSYTPLGGERGTAAAAKMAALNDMHRMIQQVRSGRATTADLARLVAGHAGPTNAAAALLEAAEQDDADIPVGGGTSGQRRSGVFDRFLGQNP